MPHVPRGEYRCECGRVFSTPQGRGQHLRHGCPWPVLDLIFTLIGDLNRHRSLPDHVRDELWNRITAMKAKGGDA